MFYYLLTAIYDGTNYSGWVKQQMAKTIQGEIEKAIKHVCKSSDFKTLGASKTDAGVHALDQKIWVELNFQPNEIGFVNGLNSFLPNDIFIKKMEVVDKDFLVRNTKEKTYTYTINIGEYDINNYRFEYLEKWKINYPKLKKSLKKFVGLHNFQNYTGLKKDEYRLFTLERKINSIKIKKNKNKIKIFFNGKGFLRYQIRMITGACLAYAKGKVLIEEIMDVLNLQKDKLPYMAKPEGLCLLKIKY